MNSYSGRSEAKKLNKKRIAKLNLQYVNEHVCYKFQTKMQLDTTENINMN